MQQRKVKIKKSTRRGHKRSTSRGTPRKDQTEHQGRRRKTPLGDSLSMAKLANFGCPCRRVRFAKKTTIRDHKRSTRETRGFAKTGHQQVQSESTDEAPESTIRDHERSTRETRGLAKTEHQQAQSDSTNEAPENTIRDQKRSTRETRDFAKTEHQQVQSKSTNEAPESKHQRDQRFCQNGAPASPIREHK